MNFKNTLFASGLAALAVKGLSRLPPQWRLAFWQRLNPWLVKGEQTPAPMFKTPETGQDRLRSSTCKQADFQTSAYRDWCELIGREPRYHRKQWEFYFIARALRERGLLGVAKRGLGFGVGKEPLAAVFAHAGCELLLTDMALETAQQQGWAATNQHATDLRELNVRKLCSEEQFLQQVRFETVDMNQVPEHLCDFDFCWSACALEHLGSIEAGLNFIKRSIACLQPGGIAVHTTEFNVCSNDATLDHAGTVLFRKRDLERLAAELAAQGHTMEPLNFDFGTAPLDAYIDLPPYRETPHLKLALEQWITTSIGIIIQKAGER